jgi:hypothetical protein
MIETMMVNKFEFILTSLTWLEDGPLNPNFWLISLCLMTGGRTCDRRHIPAILARGASLPAACRAFGLQQIMLVDHQLAADPRCVITVVDMWGFFRIVLVIIVLPFAR